MQTTSPLTGNASQLFVPQALADALKVSPKKEEPQASASIPTPPALKQDSRYARILQVEHFLDEPTCKHICDYIENSYIKNPDRCEHDRVAYHAPVTAKMDVLLRNIFLRAFVEKIEPYFHAKIQWWELPQPLRYTAGDKYDPHSDNEDWNKEGGFWEKKKDRDISCILYLNDNFSGGLLDFPDHGIKIKPSPGLLVAFPSHHGYKHGAEPTGDGLRYVLATWAAIKGVASVDPQSANRTTNIHMNEYRKE